MRRPLQAQTPGVKMHVEDFFGREWPQELPRLRRILARNGISYDDMDDVLQESAMRLHAAWGRVFEDRPLQPLITTIVLNVARDHHRRANYGVQPIDEVPDPVAVESTGVEQEVIGRLELQRAGRALAALPEQHRRAVVAAVSRELDGELQGRHRAPAATRMAVSRARRHLLAVLETTAAAIGLVAANIRQIFTSPTSRAVTVAGAGLAAFAAVMWWPADAGPAIQWNTDKGQSAMKGASAGSVSSQTNAGVDSGSAHWSERWSYGETLPPPADGDHPLKGTIRWVPPGSPLVGVNSPEGNFGVGKGDPEKTCAYRFAGGFELIYPCEWKPWTPTPPNLFANTNK